MQDIRPADDAASVTGFVEHWYWMGPGAVPLVVFKAAFISLALTAQAVRELDRFNAQDLSGALIIIGLLRDLGPLLVGLAWAARAAAYISQEREELARVGLLDFVLPRYLAAVASALPLCAFGLTVGILTSSLYAPVFGVSSTADFLEAARQSILPRDLACFFTKMIAVMPALGVLIGAAGAGLADTRRPQAAATAVAVTFVLGAFFNWIVTATFYLH